MEFQKLAERVVSNNFLCKNLKDHGLDHTLRVVEYSKMIASSLDIKQYDALLAAYFHDIGRKADDEDIGHANRSATISGPLIELYFPYNDLASILFAIKHHSDLRAPNGGFPVISNFSFPSNVNSAVSACLWDADRLDLARIKQIRRVKTNFLCTDLAREFANSEKHLSKYSKY